MIIPTKKTCAHAISERIYKAGAQTLSDLTTYFASRYQRKTLVVNLCNMVSEGILEKSQGSYTITIPMRNYFDLLEDDKPAAPPRLTSFATARQVKPFQPLSNYVLPRDGNRPGAGDHRQYKSKHF